jgi:hypothetical protein
MDLMMILRLVFLGSTLLEDEHTWTKPDTLHYHKTFMHSSDSLEIRGTKLGHLIGKIEPSKNLLHFVWYLPLPIFYSGISGGLFIRPLIDVSKRQS